MNTMDASDDAPCLACLRLHREREREREREARQREREIRESDCSNVQFW